MQTSISSGGQRLLVLGLGYSARRFVALYGPRFSKITATVRSRERMDAVPDVHVELFGPDVVAGAKLVQAAETATHVLVSLPPGSDGDAAFQRFGDILAHNRDLAWIGYLSTTGVYGDQGGRWIDEETQVMPSSARAQRRLAAEQAWQTLAGSGRSVQIFRLSGIYGPGRNALVDLREGTARRVDKPGQVFNRIHVDDIAHVLAAAIAHPVAGPIFNLADDEPAPQHEVVAYAASLLGVPAPPLTQFDEAAMSDMARSFWAENKRVRNNRLRSELGVELAFPNYREALRAMAACL